MASDWLRSASKGKIIALSATGAVATAAIAYAVYRKYFSETVTSTDEGFEEISKLEDIPEKRILILGLDGAGKSSFISCLAQKGENSHPEATEGFNVMCVHTDKVSLNIWEVGGSEKVRAFWPNFVQDTDILAYMVDSSDESRLAEAYNELHKILGDERLKHVPILILANKQDKKEAKQPSLILEAMGLNDCSDHNVRVLGIQVPPDGERVGVKEAEQLLYRMSDKK